MAELVARHASRETDVELTEQAKRLTVRQMRGQLAENARCDQRSSRNEEQHDA
jgi:hypothetical protein